MQRFADNFRKYFSLLSPEKWQAKSKNEDKSDCPLVSGLEMF